MNSKRLEPCPRHPKTGEVIYIDENNGNPDLGEVIIPACDICRTQLVFKES